MTKYFLLALALIFGFTEINAQQRPAGERPKIGTISGTVVDVATEVPLEYATVAIFNQTDSSLVTGGTTDVDGKFSIDNIPVGRFYIKANFIGYEAFLSDPFVISFQERSHAFGIIPLDAATELLEEIRVTEQKSVLVNQLDKKIFDVKQDISSQGGDGLTVLENVPSVEVDIEGNISLRGSENVRILIDGRPTAFSASDLLRQMPSNSIERVEIITNPSAKYDPEGMSGILNIITKRDRAFGFSGNANANFGYGQTAKYGAGLGLNLRNEKFNIYGNTGFNKRQYNREGFTERIFNLPDTSFRLLSENDGDREFDNIMLRAGLDYFMDKKNILYAAMTYNTGDRVNDELVEYANFNEDEELTRTADRITDGSGDNDGYELNAGWQKKFEQEGHTLDIDLNYSTNESYNRDQYEEIDFDSDGDPIFNPLLQRSLSDNETSVTSLRGDYAIPLGETARLESGLRYDRDEVDERFTRLTYDYSEGEYLDDVNISNEFLYEQDVFAAYVTYGDEWGRFSYKGGLRAEQTDMRSELLDTDEVFEQDYFSLFPSVFAGYKMSESSEFIASYSRRIDRPRTRQLNPFTDYSDPQNLRRGNPFLDPEFVDVFELGHQKIWDKFSLNTSVYHQHLTDRVQRYLEYTDDGVSVLTYENLGTSNRYGAEVVATYRPFRWWMVNLTGNYRYEKLKTVSVSQNINRETDGWSGNASSRMTLPKGFSIQLDARVRGRRETSQGYIKPMYGINLGLRKSVLDNRGNISLNVRDIFNTYKFEFVNTATPTIVENRDFSWESQVVTLALSYNFGTEVKGPRRKVDRDRRDGMDDDDMDMQ